MNTSLITGNNVTFGYGQSPVCSASSLIFESGTFNVLLGGNGAGKSTVLKTLTNEQPLINGSLVYHSVDSVDVSTRLGFVAQRVKLPRPLPLTTFEFIMLGACRLCKTGRSAAPDSAVARAQVLIERLGLTELKSTRVEHLSVGQLQRATIVRELVGEPLIIFLDESTAGVDQTFQPIVFEILSEVKNSTCVVLATHDLHHLHASIDWVYTVADGQLTRTTFAEARCC